MVKNLQSNPFETRFVFRVRLKQDASGERKLGVRENCPRHQIEIYSLCKLHLASAKKNDVNQNRMGKLFDGSNAVA